MRKILTFLGVFLIGCINVYASDKKEVTLSKCVDGDTAWFILDGDKIKTRFLAIDTPESTTKVEEYGKEASEYTCNLLTNAGTIEIEYDPDSDKLDKYDRHLVWVFVDGELLQETVIENGLAEVAYLYGDYKYTSRLEDAEKMARENKVGMWSDSSTDEDIPIIYIIIGVIIIIVCIFNKKTRKKVISKTKSSIKKQIKKAYKDL